MTTKTCFPKKCISSWKIRDPKMWIILSYYYEKCYFIIRDHNLSVVRILRPDKENFLEAGVTGKRHNEQPRIFGPKINWSTMLGFTYNFSLCNGDGIIVIHRLFTYVIKLESKSAETCEWNTLSNSWAVNLSALTNHGAINSLFTDLKSALSFSLKPPASPGGPVCLTRSPLTLT